MFGKGIVIGVIVFLLSVVVCWGAGEYVVVDTGQDKCYDNSMEMTCPEPGQPFCGQDAQYDGSQPSFTLSGDSLTVYDNNTELTWIRTPDTDGDETLDTYDQLTWAEFLAYPETLNAQNYGGYDDWRAPSIKELYSLIDFRGLDPSGPNPTNLVPFIDTTYFSFVYGDTTVGERIIDAQYWSTNQYVGTVFNGETAIFGVNFADGRIKGYPRDIGPGGTPVHYARYVRGDTAYGTNNFANNGDGTITDNATGLMWQQNDSGDSLNWEDALAYAEGTTLAGYADWRLPNAKEMQSIVDYSRGPDSTGSAAIDPLFNITEITNERGEIDYPWFWTSTTHATADGGGSAAVYVCFGRALGYMGSPGMGEWLDVHGAGAQRSDPKDGDPNNWPYGRGPQGDAIRIYNYVRCVRGGITVGENEYGQADVRSPFVLSQNHPNPFTSYTTIGYELPAASHVRLIVWNCSGQQIRVLVDRMAPAGTHIAHWDGLDARGEKATSGTYFCELQTGGIRSVKKMALVR